MLNLAGCFLKVPLIFIKYRISGKDRSMHITVFVRKNEYRRKNTKNVLYVSWQKSPFR